jgi:hypothetical protein
LSSWRRRTRRDAIIAERQLPRIRVIDAVHPLFGQPLEVSPSGLIRRIGWIRVVLPDGRHRWVPQKAADLNVSACEARPNRDLPLVSVRTLIPLAEYVRARLSALGERFDEAQRPLCSSAPSPTPIPRRAPGRRARPAARRERLLGIDHPLGLAQRREEGSECSRLGEGGVVAEERKATGRRLDPT